MNAFADEAEPHDENAIDLASAPVIEDGEEEIMSVLSTPAISALSSQTSTSRSAQGRQPSLK